MYYSQIVNDAKTLHLCNIIKPVCAGVTNVQQVWERNSIDNRGSTNSTDRRVGFGRWEAKEKGYRSGRINLRASSSVQFTCHSLSNDHIPKRNASCIANSLDIYIQRQYHCVHHLLCHRMGPIVLF